MSSLSGVVRAMDSKSVADLPLAYRLPTKLPTLVPTTKFGVILLASNALMTPTWAKPLAPPPPNTKAITGRLVLVEEVEVALSSTGRVLQAVNSSDPVRLKPTTTDFR